MTSERKALLIVRAGDRSLHRHWISGVRASAISRNFDLHVSYFGDKRDPYPGQPSDITLTREKGGKFPGLLTCLDKIGDRLDSYAYIGIPDDDLYASQETWEEFIRVICAYNPIVAQPALTRNSYYSYDILLQRPRYKLRWTNLVEVMTPFFRADHFSQIRETFGANNSGWGLDRLWPRQFCSVDRTMCVVDKTPILHTREIGTGPLYKRLKLDGEKDPGYDLRSFLNEWGIEVEKERVYAAVDNNGRVLEEVDVSHRKLLSPRLRRKARRWSGRRELEIPPSTRSSSGE